MTNFRLDRNLRRSALQRIALLSAKSRGTAGQPAAADRDISKPVDEDNDFNRLTRECEVRSAPSENAGLLNGIVSAVATATGTGAITSHTALSVRELEVVLALCHSAPYLQSENAATKLLDTLVPYLEESTRPDIVPSPYLKGFEPCPWEALSASLTEALLTLGGKFPALRDRAISVIETYLRNVQSLSSAAVDISTDLEALPAATLVVSLLGFLSAAATRMDIWQPEERLDLVTYIRGILSSEFLLTVETAFSTIRNSHERDLRQWKKYARHYAATGRPLGAMLLQQGFTRLLAAATTLLVAEPTVLKDERVLDYLMSRAAVKHKSVVSSPSSENRKSYFALEAPPAAPMLNGMNGSATILRSESLNETVSRYIELAAEELALLDDGADYLQLGTAWQQRLAFSVKAYALTAFCCCAEVHVSPRNEEDYEQEDYIANLIKWLESIMEDSVQMADQTLAKTVLKAIAVVARNDRSFAVTVSRLLPRFVVRSGVEAETVKIAGKCLANVLRFLSQDAIITTLYTLGNVLSSGNPERALTGPSPRERLAPGLTEQHNMGSAISLSLNTDEEKFSVYERVVEAIVGVASDLKDEKIVALAASILIQKIGKVAPAVDAKIIRELSEMAIVGGVNEMKTVLKLYDRLGSTAVGMRDVNIAGAVLDARIKLSKTLSKDSARRETYLVSLLECIINKGDIHEYESKRLTDVEVRTTLPESPKLRFLGGSSMFLNLDIVQLAAREISQILQPLAILLSPHSPDVEETPPYSITMNQDVQSLFRDAWFNCVVHGFLRNSELAQSHDAFLRIIARHSPPLVAESRINQTESDLELNTVLRRGMNSQNTQEQKKKLISALPTNEGEIRSLSYPKVIFLQAALLLESLRASEGDCTKVLTYFVDPTFKSGDTAHCMSSIANEVMAIYVRKVLQGQHASFTASHVAKQLVELIVGCCHRVEKVQTISAACADRMISAVPSALCHQSSLFALLEAISLLWTSCLDAEIDEYSWKSQFTSGKGKITIELSDSYALRRKTLKNLVARAKVWVLRVIDRAPMDVKGLLQTYLSEVDDEGAFGHVSLGRSFAYEMGAAVPTSDPRLASIENLGDCEINIASDFMAQFTMRQAYRHEDRLPDISSDWTEADSQRALVPPSSTDVDAETILAHLELRARNRKFVSTAEVRDVLRSAAGLLCRSKMEQTAIIYHFVGIPFAIFTKQSIKFGIGLWLGCVNENPMLESRILNEIAQNWEMTVRRKQGLFSQAFDPPNAFTCKMEYAPSSKEQNMKNQTTAINNLSPHLRILQFLSSRFHASRHSSPHILRIFHRVIRITLEGLKSGSGHPLAREVRFQFILFSLQVLKHSPGLLSNTLQWKMKDQILSAALAWFKFPPRWSFGGSRVQLKAEAALMKDVVTTLNSIASIANPASKSLETKQELLLTLLEHEQQRVNTWLNPVDHHRKEGHHSTTQPIEQVLVNLLPVAWNESPALALQLPARFPSKRLETEFRKLMIMYPERVVDNPNALQLILGDRLPNDLNFQLRYLLFWAPLNPISAATYFLPSYANNPFILQYAMRALEHHSVDVTFFYVPQIVQTLRYDSLGYVERFILETAKFSQLFAHQIIWNMKANAYKDEDSQVPDPVKPTLDKVMDHLVNSFSPVDKNFYEREFSFFGEVTSISGKLRPFIKAPKAEKKAKIEEELRKIKVDVGVYLPSNPDGVVVGIDRKSGKPLQSHAKAPYMATFRIRKKAANSVTSEEAPSRAENRVTLAGEELWQSAIFKVGDDCRQDMLALQLISAFRSIFNGVGLDVYVFPYRVTATAPGCGVIDVLPNSISRDMLGREAVNGLYDYFTTKHGGEDSIRFQEARNAFVQSMAAYSVISFLLQFKDRHNGNIMIDDAGHILHIDFGFCFDIAPGGITFERAPFKLTSEMIAVMGGSTESQSFRWFEELCVKSFLASRPYSEQLIHCVTLMLDSGLPCFKPETIQNFRDRFVLDKSERDAAEFMRSLVKKAYSSYTTGVYDQFQLWTNGIPY